MSLLDFSIVPDAAAVRAAAARLRSFLSPSRLVRSDALSDQLGIEVLFKLELENPTGSFKVRGAYNVLAGLSPEERARGVVASSAGNHGLGVAYAAKAAPTVAVRIQDLYGVEGEIRIANGRVPLVIEVLAPNQRPLQVTQNLSNFWRENYPKIKQELQRKYPRHEWR